MKILICSWQKTAKKLQEASMTQVHRIHPLGTMGLCTKLHNIEMCRCQDISVWTKMVEKALKCKVIHYPKTIKHVFAVIVLVVSNFSKSSHKGIQVAAFWPLFPGFQLTCVVGLHLQSSWLILRMNLQAQKSPTFKSELHPPQQNVFWVI